MAGWVLGGWYTGYSPSDPRIGIARAQPVARPALSASARHSRALPGPSAHLAPRTQHVGLRTLSGRDSGIYILKLVNMLECRRKSVMRPAIVPVPKKRSKSHDLEF